MATFVRLLLVCLLLVSTLLIVPAPARAAEPVPPVPGPCVDGTLPSGALSRICIPSAGWNGDLVVWAHGYVPFYEPLGFYNLTLADGTYLPDLVQSLGYAFATTSYRQNGLTILEGVQDVRELVAAFPGAAGQAPGHTYMTGASEGGIVTTLLVEQSPELFSGGLSACGPIGDFKKQTDYFGDFRVLFDYFFPNLLPASPINIPPQLIADWETVYKPAVAAAAAANPSATRQLMRTGRAATDPLRGSSAVDTTVNVLWYNVFATNDATQKLGGNPYTNRGRWYFGSNNDFRLNAMVQRFDANPAARQALNQYQTSGHVTLPLVTIHTTGDEIIPFWHQVLYRAKVQTSGNGRVIQIPVLRYGHCNFTSVEVLAAFALLVLQAEGKELDVPLRYDLEQVEKQFNEAAQKVAAE